ncbi:MAG: hypothetical protein ABIN91_19355 [Mucilaginibacter sp.]|uniref:hypothetical protein n=1 Tax=Mucilaginibacter sp. TaxID=1882438 RepID=UPI003264198D
MNNEKNSINRDQLNIPRHALSHYFERAALDERLFPSHISLFMALFYFSGTDIPGDIFQVSRAKLMRFSRIRSVATYHKNVKELTAYGYIEYTPSWHPHRGSSVRLLCGTVANN